MVASRDGKWAGDSVNWKIVLLVLTTAANLAAKKVVVSAVMTVEQKAAYWAFWLVESSVVVRAVLTAARSAVQMAGGSADLMGALWVALMADDWADSMVEH